MRIKYRETHDNQAVAMKNKFTIANDSCLMEEWIRKSYKAKYKSANAYRCGWVNFFGNQDVEDTLYDAE